jgi:hypothetical protein
MTNEDSDLKSFGAENADPNEKPSKPEGLDQLPVLFREKFTETYGHPPQRGNLQYTVQHGVAVQ